MIEDYGDGCDVTWQLQTTSTVADVIVESLLLPVQRCHGQGRPTAACVLSFSNPPHYKYMHISPAKQTSYILLLDIRIMYAYLHSYLINI